MWLARQCAGKTRMIERLATILSEFGDGRPVRREEASALLVLALMCACGWFQLIFAVTIPSLSTGVLGLLVLICATIFAQEIWQHRSVQTRLVLGVFQPLPFIILAYADYVKLVGQTRLERMRGRPAPARRLTD